MLADNTLTLLAGINNKLDTIVQSMMPQNTTPDSTASIARSNRGSLDSVNINQPKATTNSIKIDAAGGSLKTLNDNLGNIPSSVKGIASLHGRTIDKFLKVLTKLNEGVKDIKPNENLEKWSESLKALGGLSSLPATMESFGKIKSGDLKSFEKGMTSICKVMEKISKKNKVSAESIKVLGDMVEVMHSATRLVKDLAKIAIITPIAILGAKALTPIITTFAKTVAKVSEIKGIDKGIEQLKELDKFSKSVIRFAASGVAMTLACLGIGLLMKKHAADIFLGLGGISAVLLGFTAVSALTAVVGKKVSADSKWFKVITQFALAGIGLTALTAAIGFLTPVIMKPALAGISLVSLTLLGYTAVSFLAALAGQHVKLNTVWFKVITQFALAGIALTILTAIIGGASPALLPPAMLGIGMVASTLLAYATVSFLAAKLGQFVKINTKWFAVITQFAVAGMALTLFSAALGVVVEQYWDKVLYGMGAISGTMLLIAGVASVINRVSIPSKKALINIGILEGLFAASGALVLEAIGVGTMISKHIKETLIGLTSMEVVMRRIGRLSNVAAKVKVTPAALRKLGILSGFFAASGALVLEAIGVGTLVNKYIGAAISGIASMTGIILLISKLSDTVSKAKVSMTAFKSLGMLSAIFAASGALVLEAVGVGLIVNKHIDAAFGGVISMTIMFGLVARLAEFAGKIKTNKTAIKNIALLSAVFAASGALVLEALGVGLLINKHTKAAINGIISMTIMFGLVEGFTHLAGKIKTNKTAIKNIALLSAVFAASGALVLEALGVGLLVNKDIDAAITGIVGMIGVIGVCAGLGLLASKLKVTKTAIRNLALLNGVAAASGLVLAEIIGINAIKEKAGVNWGDIFISLGAMTSITAAMGALAFVAGKLPGLKSGAVSLLLVEAVAAGAALVLAGVIKLAKSANELGPKPWAQIFTTVGAMATIVTGFGAICTAAGFVAPFLIPGEIAMAGIVGIAALILKVVNRVVDLQERLKEVKTTPDELGSTLKGVMSIFKKENLELPMKAGDILKLNAQYIAVLPIINGIGRVADAMSKMVSAVGGMDDNGNIRPIVGRNADGSPIYAEKSINLEKATGVIVGALSTFVTKIRSAFSGFDLGEGLSMGAGMAVITLILSPVSKFAEVLTGFQDAGENMIMPVKFDENGKRIDLPPVNVVSVATSIAGAVTSFAKVLFSKENSKMWEGIVMGEGKGFLGLPKINIAQMAGLGVLALVLTPVSTFVDMLSKFGETADGELGIFETNAEGKKELRKLNIVSIAGTIAGAVTKFARELFVNHREEWDAMTKSEDGVNVFAGVIEPVSNFANMLSMFTQSDKGELLIMKDGEKAAGVNVITAATKISSAVSIFVSKMAETFKNPDIEAVSASKVAVDLFFKTVKSSVDSIISIKEESIEGKMKVISEVDGFIKSASATFKFDETMSSTMKTSAVHAKSFMRSLKSIVNAFSGFKSKSIESFGKEFSRFASLFHSGFRSLKWTLSLTNDNAFDMTKLKNILKNVTESFDMLGKVSDTSQKLQAGSDNFKTFTNAINATNKVIEQFHIPEVEINNVSRLGDSMMEAAKKVNMTITKESISNLKSFTIKVNDAHGSIKKFDDLLTRNSNKRNNALKEFAEKLGEVADKFDSMSDDLKAFSDLIAALNELNADKVKEVITEMGNINFGGGGSGGSGLSSDAVRNAVSKAITESFDGLTLRANGDNTMPEPLGKDSALISAIKSLADSITNNTYKLEMNNS